MADPRPPSSPPAGTGVAALLCAIALAGCGGGGGVSSPPPAGRVATAPASARRAPVAPASPHGLIALRRDLRRQMRRAGAASAAYVYDVSAHRALFSERADVARPPASIEKLYTTIALLTRLGPDERLYTRVLGSGRRGSHGTWRGDLFLQGDGDPTFGSASFVATWDEGNGATLEDLVGQLVQRDAIQRVAGSVVGDGSLFDDRPGGPATAYGPDIPDLGGELGALTYNHGTSGRVSPAAYAARALARALHKARVVTADPTRVAPTPATASLLAEVSSPPISVLVGHMNRFSDDFFAELLTEQLGARFAGSGSIAAGARVIAHSLPLPGPTPQIVDGSGLSRADSSTPRQVVELLSAVAGTPAGQILAGSLPVAGVSGTLVSRMRGTPAQGRCQAKTGTLNDVANLAGYCHSRGGHLIAFALFMGGADTQRLHSILDAMAITIARDDPRRR